VTAERAFLAELNAGCSLPVAALGGVDGEELTLQGLVVSLDGRQVVRVSASGPATEPEQLGRNLARQALAKGAQAILEAIRVKAS
jgi:hydroxymethylbilane synthase